MARYILRCDDCGQKYAFTPASADEEFPNCPACTAGKRRYAKPFSPAAPGIQKSPLTKSWDKTARAVCDASVERARQAAAMAGVPEKDMAHLKVNDLRDPTNMREGDTAAIMPAPSREYQQLQAQLRGGGGFNPIQTGGGMLTGEMFAAAASQGVGARSGMGTLLNVIKPNHSANVAYQGAATLNRR